MIKIQENIPLAPLCWWKVGGCADFFAEPSTLPELKEACFWAQKNYHDVHILSGGSNVLISDRGVRGLTIHLKKFSQILKSEEIGGRWVIDCLSGTPKSEVMKIFLQQKLSPALFLTGLPGDMGGGVVMNAGVGDTMNPREFCEIVDSVYVLRTDTLVEEKIDGSRFHWSYRQSQGWQPGIITRVQVSWPVEQDNELMTKVKQVNKNRIARQPLSQPSGGSTFRNPEGDKAGRLIESLGLKGHKIGGAEVSHKHANFLVTYPGAKAQDVADLIQYVRKNALEKAGTLLNEEVIYFGEWLDR